MAQVSPTAALAGVPAGLQAQGVWAGRRQLFIRFAAEAETRPHLYGKREPRPRRRARRPAGPPKRAS